MADSTAKKRIQGGLHSAEVFGEEIQELEKSQPVKSWSSWLAGFGAVTLVISIVLLLMTHEGRTYRAPYGIGNVRPVQLIQPEGEIDHLPSAFRWDAVDGVKSYLVTVSREDTDEVVLVRPALGTFLAASAEDLSVFRRGKYRWSVDARGEDGKTKAWGEGAFDIKM